MVTDQSSELNQGYTLIITSILVRDSGSICHYVNTNGPLSFQTLKLRSITEQNNIGLYLINFGLQEKFKQNSIQW